MSLLENPLIESIQWVSAAIFFKWKQKIKTSRKLREFGSKINIFDQE